MISWTVLLVVAVISALIPQSNQQECFEFFYAGPTYQLGTGNTGLVPLPVTLNATVDTLAVLNVTGYDSNFLNTGFQLLNPAANELSLFGGACNLGNYFNLTFNDTALTIFANICAEINNTAIVVRANQELSPFFRNSLTYGDWNIRIFEDAVLFGNITGYGLNICPFYYDLGMDVDETSVAAGENIAFNLTVDGAMNVTANVTLECAGDLFTFGYFDTNLGIQQFPVPINFAGPCLFNATAPFNEATYSPISVAVNVTNTIEFTLPLSGSVYTNGQNFEFYLSSPYTGTLQYQPLGLTYCSMPDYGEQFAADINLPVGNPISYLMYGPCTINVTDATYFGDSNTIDITVYSELTIIFLDYSPQPYLVTGGSQLGLRVNSTRRDEQLVRVTTTCGSRSSFRDFPSNTDYTYQFDANLSGIGCVMSVKMANPLDTYTLSNSFTFNVNVGSAFAQEFLNGCIPGTFNGAVERSLEQQGTLKRLTKKAKSMKLAKAPTKQHRKRKY